MTTPPVSPGPDQPYTLSNLMPAPSGTAPASVPPPPGPPPGFVPPAPTRKPHWWRDAGTGGRVAIVGGAIGILLIASLAVVTSLGVKLGGGLPDGVTFDVVGCEYSGDTLPAVTAEFTATNSSGRDHRLKIRWEYRDSSGALIDTDTSYVTVPAGDTIRDSETTLLPVAASGGKCEAAVS